MRRPCRHYRIESLLRDTTIKPLLGLDLGAIARRATAWFAARAHAVGAAVKRWWAA